MVEKFEDVSSLLPFIQGQTSIFLSISSDGYASDAK